MKILVRNNHYSTAFVVNEKTGDMLLKNPNYAASILEALNKQDGTDYIITETEILNLTGKHICQYCGNVVEGDYEDLLCDECREIFGHSLYSEL